MRIQNQPAYLLHWRPWSESSLLLDLFTRTHGRLALLAKGARRGRSRTRGALLPFQPLLASWSGKGQLPVLTGVEIAAVVPRPTGAALGCGYYMNELLLKLLHRFDPHERLFDAYDVAVVRLGSQAGDNNAAERALRIFEKALLSETGFGLILDRDVRTGEAIDPGRDYQYLPGRGPVAAGEGKEGAGLMVRGETLLALGRESLVDARSLRESKRLTRMLLHQQLGGRPIRSREVVVQMSRYRGPLAGAAGKEGGAGRQS